MKIHRMGTLISYCDLTDTTLCDKEYNLLQKSQVKQKWIAGLVLKEIYTKIVNLLLISKNQLPMF